MKNILPLFLLVLVLHPSLLSSQALSHRAYETDSLFTIADSSLAFRVRAPFKKALPYPAGSDKNVRSRLYYGIDSAGDTRYMFGLSVLRPGIYTVDDSSYYSSLKKGLEAPFKQVIRDTGYFVDGHFVEDIYGTANTGDRFMAYRYIARGNSWYMLAADFPQPALLPKVRAFFDSFSMLEYPVSAWHRTTDPDSLLTTWTPTPLFAYNGDTTKNHMVVSRYYLAFDSTHYNSYLITRQQLSPYLWSPSDSALYTEMIATQLLPTDSLVYKRPVSNGDARGWEWMRKSRGGSMYRRERILLNSDRLYFLYTCASKDDVASPNTNRFFEDFRFIRPVDKTDISKSRAGVLLDDLFGPDPTAAAAALVYVTHAPFGKNDLPRLHSLLLKFPNYRGGLNAFKVDASLTNRIIHINDSSSFHWAAAHYKAIPATQDYIKGFLLKIMGSFPSPAHYSKMAALLQDSPPGILPIDFLWMLGDYLRETARIMPQLLSIPTDSLSRPFVIDLAGKLADSSMLTATKLRPFQSYLLRYAAGRIAYLSTDAGSPRITDGALISLLGLLNTDSSNAALREYLEMEFHDERVKAFAALLRNGKQKAEDIQSLAGDKSTRLDLYRVLEKAGRLPLFPMAFRTPKMLSESAAYSTTMKFELEPPSSFDFLDMKIKGTGPALKRYFFYKIRSKNGLTHLACAGPYSQDPDQTGLTQAAAIYDYQHQFDPVHADEQISDLLARFN